MKVLFITDSLRRGGKERQLTELAMNLVNRNHSISIVVFDKNIQYEELLEIGVNIVVLNKKKFNLVKSVFELFSIVKRQQPDIVHSWSSLTTLMIFPAVKTYNVKLIDSIRYAKQIKRFSQKWFISNLAFLVSNRVIANSNAGLKTHGKNPGKKYKTIYNGYRFLNPSPQSKSIEKKKMLGIREKFVVGMVATFHPGKDYISYIRAAKIILKDRNDICFMCIGGGKNKMEIENSIEKEYRPFIKFTGKRDDVESIIEIFDVGVLLSNINVSAEGISNALTEIMAAGKPVIATKAGGNTELISNETDGFLIDAFAIDQLVDNIRLLIKNDVLREKMGQHAKEKIQNQFSVDKMVNNYLNTYQELSK